MNYSEFYRNAKRRSIETLVSMWAGGNVSYQNYFRYLLESEEKLFAEPVFQSTFPWKSSSRKFGELLEIFSEEFISSLDEIQNEEYRFPKDRYPYVHQELSWQNLLNENKSIVVTSGTGSGKTECFMMPVLQDLMNHKESEAIQAIFLYPLNALIGSQKKRMNAWCRALGNIRYAVYNGKTPEDVNPNAQRENYPEIISRTDIRRQPPQVLFTNPTMLEYMMVREKDQTIINKSQGKLRWILLDEAHTFTGSAASEIALLIRRVLDAFGVTADQIRFAATSATIGDKDDPETVERLKSFMSQLTGQPKDRIEIIGGKRIVPEINEDYLPDELNGIPISSQEIIALRESISLSSAKTCSEISGVVDIEEGLKTIDELSTPINGLMADMSAGAILPTRGHFFARSMSGAFVCLNPNCQVHTDQNTFERDNRILGTITTNTKTKCTCGSPMFELVRCGRCGEFLAMGELNSYDGTYRASKTDPNESIFDVENEPIDEDGQVVENRNPNFEWVKIVLAQGSNRLHPIDSAQMGIHKVEDIFTVNEGDPNGHLGFNPSNQICPCCKADVGKFRHLRFSSGFFNRILSSTLLEQAPATPNNPNLIWEGRKYIAFTDSRQGTAKSALAQNIDTERIWIQSRILHHLSTKRTENIFPLSEEERAQLQIYRTHPNLFRQEIENMESRENALENPDRLPVHPIPWSDLFREFVNDTHITNDLIILGKAILNIDPTKHANSQVITNKHEDYLHWLLIDQFSRRPKSANSPENLGFVRCVYPSLNALDAPPEFLALNPTLTISSWRDFLKICIDYYLRDSLFVDIADNIFKFRTSFYFFRKSIYPSDFDAPEGRRKYLKWPSFNNSGHYNRLVLLICKAANWNTQDDLGHMEIDIINDILQSAWNDLIRVGILRRKEDGGYSVRLETSMAFEVLKEAWLCPVTNVPLDVTFMGLSPRITGSLSDDTFNRYSVSQESHISYPCFPYANQTDNLGNRQKVNNETVLNWIEESFNHIKDLGLWSNIHERMFLKPEIYLAAEHSAQQDSKRLEQIEAKFEKGELNILSCSTTMEMGVDIGGISEVVMNNVPPSPANYLQRAGRAGRRNETKSLSLTFCGPNPIGRNVMENPLWPMTHEIILPRVRFESPNIVQRHINSYLFSKFVTTQIENQHGIAITGKLDGFFGNSKEIVEEYIPGTIYSQFHDYLIDLFNNQTELITTGLDKLKKETVLARKYNHTLISECLSVIKTVNKIYIDQLNEINQGIISLTEDGFGENSPAIKSLLFKRGSLIGKPLLGYLAEKLFLPNANMPTGVVEFDITNKDDIQTRINNQRRNYNVINQEDNSSYSISSENPSFHIARALAEYAPGRQIVLNQFCYTSEGVQLKSRWTEQSMLRIQKCTNGHTSLKMFENLSCHCGGRYISIHNGGNNIYAEAIEPAGFSVDIRSEPTRVIDNDQLSIVDTELINVTDWGEDANVFKLESRTSLSDSEIMYYNNGNGFGYAVCIHCGRAEKESGIKQAGDGKLNLHKRLRGGRNENNDEYCTGSDNNAFGIRRNTLLIGRLQTDFVELRFHDDHGYINEKDTIRSLGVVFAQALSQCLGINESEISYGVKNYHGFHTAYLYDTAKGGAGYSNQFNFYIEEVLLIARERLNRCDCPKSCTKCLINNSSQWYLEELDRNKAREWLNLEFNAREVVPEEILSISPNAKQVTREVVTEIHRWIDRSSSFELTIFINNDSENWNVENWKLIEKAKEYRFVHNKVVNFVLLGTPDINIESYSDIIGLKNWANVFVIQFPEAFIRIPLAIVKMETQGILTVKHFYSQAINNEFNELWGKNEIVYMDEQNIDYHLNEYDPTLSIDSNIKMFYIRELSATSKTVADILIGILTNDHSVFLQKIRTDFENKSVTISYSDRYIVSKFSAILALQFIQRLSQYLNLEIEHLKLNFQPVRRDNVRPCLKVWDQWNTDDERSEYIKNAVFDLELVSEDELVLNNSARSAHFRQLIIESEDHILTIQPDGGIAYGWNFDREPGNYQDGDYSLVESDEDMNIVNITRDDGIQYIIELE